MWLKKIPQFSQPSFVHPMDIYGHLLTCDEGLVIRVGVSAVTSLVPTPLRDVYQYPKIKFVSFFSLPLHADVRGVWHTSSYPPVSPRRM